MKKRSRRLHKHRRHSRKRGGGTKRHRALMKATCSPKLKEKITGFSCYTYDDLRYLRNLWNKHHPTDLIDTNDVRDIHAALMKKNAVKCGDKEACWLRQPFVKESVGQQIRKFAFAPEAPKEWEKNPNEWLSSTEIEDVMGQYEKAYKCFRFIGPSPIDFDKQLSSGGTVFPELSELSLSKLQNDGIKKVGIILNTDPHDKGGQHWISMFINIPRGLVYFFDSVGAPAPTEVMRLVERIKTQGAGLSPPIAFKFDQNHPVEHQYGNTECGIYSLFFIVHMLEDKITEHYLKTHILRDKYMEKFRKVYFNARGRL